MWGALIGAAAPLIGSLFDKDDRKKPDKVPTLDLQELARAMMVNTSSPYGGMTYTQGDDGQWTGEYQFSDEVQPLFDRSIERGMTPDQAYQAPEELGALKQALMSQRLEGPVRREPPERRQRPQLYRPRSTFPLKYGPPAYDEDG